MAVDLDREREVFVGAVGGFDPLTDDRNEVRGAGLFTGAALVSGLESPCLAVDDAVGAVRCEEILTGLVTSLCLAGFVASFGPAAEGALDS